MGGMCLDLTQCRSSRDSQLITLQTGSSNFDFSQMNFHPNDCLLFVFFLDGTELVLETEDRMIVLENRTFHSRVGSSGTQTAAPFQRCFDDPSRCTQFLSVQMTPTGELAIESKLHNEQCHVNLSASLQRKGCVPVTWQLTPLHSDIVGKAAVIGQIEIDRKTRTPIPTSTLFCWL